MNLENISYIDYPFRHWEISNCLDAGVCKNFMYDHP